MYVYIYIYIHIYIYISDVLRAAIGRRHVERGGRQLAPPGGAPFYYSIVIMLFRTVL